MGFIKAFAGAIGGTFADQWKDFFEQLVFIQQYHKGQMQVEEKTQKVLITLFRMEVK